MCEVITIIVIFVSYVRIDQIISNSWTNLFLSYKYLLETMFVLYLLVTIIILLV